MDAKKIEWKHLNISHPGRSRFKARKENISTFSVARHSRYLFAINPDLERNRSHGTDVQGIPKYLRTREACDGSSPFMIPSPNKWIIDLNFSTYCLWWWMAFPLTALLLAASWPSVSVVIIPSHGFLLGGRDGRKEVELSDLKAIVMELGVLELLPRCSVFSSWLRQVRLLKCGSERHAIRLVCVFKSNCDRCALVVWILLRTRYRQCQITGLLNCFSDIFSYRV